MRNFCISLLPMVFLANVVFSQNVNIIFDTDMGPDYDDVGAMAMLHAFADEGKIDILATMASTNYRHVGDVLSIINTYFLKPEIPVGVSGDYGVDLRDWQYWSDSLVNTYADLIPQNRNYKDAVSLYRQLLSEAEDGSVTIVTVGFLSNIAALLTSDPDAFSPLPGRELMERKVDNLISMAGKFPEGMEFNIEMDAQAARTILELWKGDWILSGFEIGDKIFTGLPLIHNESIRNSPIKDVYRISIPMAEEDENGRMSWDQTAVLVAALGYGDFFELEKGKLILKEDGYNYWKKGEGRHFILKQKSPFSSIQNIIDGYMMHQPVKTKK